MPERISPTSVLAHVEVGVVVLDRTATILFANPKAFVLLGSSEREMLGSTSFDPRWQAVTPDGVAIPAEQHPVVQAIRTGQPVRDTVLGFRKGSGERVWLQITAIPTLDASGAVDAVYATFTDVSRGQALQNRLTSTYEATIRSMAEGVAILGRDGKMLSANPSAERILGLTLAQMQGRQPMHPDWKLLRPDGSLMPPEEFPSELTRRTGEPCRDARVMVHRGNGDNAWLSVATDLLIGIDDDEPLGVLSTFTDITAHVEATRALHEQRALLRRVTDAVPGVLYRHMILPDDTDVFQFVSGRALDVLGIDPESILHSSEALWSRVHPDDVASVRAAIISDARVLRRAAKAGVVQEQRFDEEFRVAMPDGSWRWVRAQSLGTLVGADMLCHGLITDVTDRRMLAEQLRASQRQELIGVLVSGIAHNFNNMLAAILPNLERVSQTASGELRQEIADAYDASKSAADLVRHLMLLVRRDELRAAEPVDIVELVHDVMRMCRRTFDQRIAIETTAPPSTMIVLGRRSELQQVILNLCINARDAVEAVEMPLIEVEVHPLPRAHVGVTVRDNGTGMTAEAMRRVGQPFFTTKAQGKGTGLGVATALGIVGEMGGALTWSSHLGAGATFHLSLPLAPLPRAQESADAPARPRRFSGQIVLVIDDEPLVRKTLARLLEALGLTVLLASTGREGLEMLAARDDIVLVLLDLSMPEMSGAEVLSRIAALRPSLPVFVVSGWVAEPEVLGSARGVIQKPFTTRELADALSSVLTPEP